MGSAPPPRPRALGPGAIGDLTTVAAIDGLVCSLGLSGTVLFLCVWLPAELLVVSKGEFGGVQVPWQRVSGATFVERSSERKL